MVRILICIALAFATAAWGEHFNARKVNTVFLSEAETVSLGVEDALRVKLPEDMTYICGIELNMKIPKEIASLPSSVEYSLYEDVSSANGAFSGTKSFSATIPPRFSLNVYIPLTAEFAIKDSPYSERIPVVPHCKDGSVFFRFENVAEKSRDLIAKTIIDVEVKPVLSGKGTLKLLVSPAQEEEIPSLRKNISRRGDGSYSVFIDGEPINETQAILLKAGEHRASIVSESFRNELRTFVVEEGRTTNLTVELRSIEPTLIFICPSPTQIYFDGVKIENPRREFLIDSGEHSARMVVGDYEIIRTFTASYGKSYTMSLDIESSIREN